MSNSKGGRRNNHAGYRAQWRSLRTLWTVGQEERLYNLVASALVAEFGPFGRYDGAVIPDDPWEPPMYASGESADADANDDDYLPAPPSPGTRRDDGCYTLEEIGAALGVTRERARQIEANALRKFARGLYEECPDLWHGRPFSPAPVSAGRLRRDRSAERIAAALKRARDKRDDILASALKRARIAANNTTTTRGAKEAA